jgi:hypothetical protein
MPGIYDIEIQKGADFILTISSDEYVFSDYDAVLIARYEKLDGDLAIDLSTTNSKIIMTETDLTLKMSNEETNLLNADKSCNYKLDLIRKSDEFIIPLIKGDINIIESTQDIV